jgi:hypothetical protein
MTGPSRRGSQDGKSNSERPVRQSGGRALSKGRQQCSLHDRADRSLHPLKNLGFVLGVERDGRINSLIKVIANLKHSGRITLPEGPRLGMKMDAQTVVSRHLDGVRRKQVGTRQWNA